jgi:uncharacterized OsmC-like protein
MTMDLPAELKESTEKMYSARTDAEKLTEDEKRNKFRRAVRVTAKYTEGLRKELHVGDITWFSDAAKAVGGKGEYPSALAHFVAGLPLCQMTHYAERAAVWGMQIKDLEVSAVGHYVGLGGYGFDEVEYDVRLVSPEPREKIGKLASAAATDCYVTNTLKHACKVSGHIFLNGEHIQDL